MIIKCANCGVGISIYPYKKGTAKYCSRKCLGEYRSKNKIGPLSGNWKGGGAWKVCKVCAKKFYISKWENEKGNGKFCSRKCLHIHLSTLRGDKAYNWRGGVSAKAHLIRTSLKYRNWVKIVHKKDNYTCTKCGKRGGEINAHHKKRFSIYPELAFDINNGVTLCIKCHREEHKNEINK